MISLPGQKETVQKAGQWQWAPGWIQRIWGERKSCSKNFLLTEIHPSSYSCLEQTQYGGKTQPLVWPQVLRLGSTKNYSWLKSLQPGRFPRTLWSRTFMYVCSCLVDLHKQDETFASHCIYASHVPSAIWMPNPISLPLTSRFLLWQGLSSFALCHSSNHHLYNVYALKMLALTIPSGN